MSAERLVLAVGGNALLRAEDSGSIEEQAARARGVLRHVARLAADDREIVLTHGNAPIVGNILLRNEAARDTVTPMPLYIDDADSQGGIGFLMQNTLENELSSLGVDRGVVTLVTQVQVDPADPAFHRPTKPVGPRYTEEQAERLLRLEDWYFSEETDGAFRRVVPSPLPMRIIEIAAVRELMAAGTVVIACGGGGVPVVESEDGSLEGIDAVVDKDLASSLLARELDADLLVILMEEDRVYLGWGTDHATGLDEVELDDLDAHIEAGAFDEGSMLPKARAVAEFVRATGREALVCRAEDLSTALAGESGTRITT